MENIQSNIQGDNMETTTIQQLFQEFINDGGEPKVTSFKRHLDKLINQEIKGLCGRSAKTGLVDDWRSEVKLRFSGRGAKWVKVSVEDILPTLEEFDDSTEYMGWVQTAGFAWIRFAGPRVANGSNCAAFEVRTGGSTIDHPKQLHYIPVHDLDEKIESLNSTPHAMRLEVAMTPVVEDEVSSNEVVEVEEDYEDMMGDIEDLMDDEDDLDF
tara:strand:- start:532 stop:1167 length:636 start_codon:yes stop_codon:yes gene_type:complete